MTHTTTQVGWKVTKLGTLVQKFISGGTPPTKNDSFWDGNVAWTTSAPITDTDVSLNSAQRYISEHGLANSASNLVPRGSLLVGTRVGVGKAVVNLIDVAISQDLTGVVLNSEVVDPYYVAYQFKTHSVQSFIDGRKRGTTIQGISRFDLESIELLLPPLPEQRAIARVLRAVQQAKAARQRQVELERERKTALMQHLFTYGTRKEPTKQTDIGEMPESWRVISIGEAYRFTTKPADLRLADFEQIPFVPMEMVPNEYPYFTEYIPQARDDISSGTYFEVGDLLVAKITPSFENGKQGIIDELPTPFGIATTEVIPVRPIPDLSDRLFLFYHLLRKEVRAELAGKMEGTTGRQRLKKLVLTIHRMPLPPVDEQHQISTVLFNCDVKIASLLREVYVLEEFFRAMLEELMSGRLSVAPLLEGGNDHE